MDLAIEAFDAFVDGVVEEISQLKSALKHGSGNAEGAAETLRETAVTPSDAPDVEPVEDRGGGKSLERTPG